MPLQIPLKEIRFVLLDMDGTLLDKYFDDFFWEHLLPERYAEKKKISFAEARAVLLQQYKTHEGTLNWTDIDFWSRQVEIDIPALKEQIHHLIAVHPHVEEFLTLMRRQGKKIFLLTNAHYKVLDIKMKKTELGGYLDAALTSFEVGYPKEMIEFWDKAEARLGFRKETSLFIDDTEAVLRTARAFGIKYPVLKAVASSKSAKQESADFVSIDSFSELIV